MKKRMVWTIIVLIIVFGGLIAFNMVRKAMLNWYIKHHQPPPVTISTTQAKEQNWQPRLFAIGSLVAVNGVMVTPEVSGLVVKINFQSGELVKEGESLIQLDDAINKTELANNQAKLTLDKLDFKRKASLYKSKAISSSDYDRAVANMQQSQAMVDKTLVTISKKNVRAPFSGKIGIREVNIGQYLNPGDTIVSLQSLDPMFVNYTLPEKNLTQVHVGQKISIVSDAYPGKTFYGKITAIDSEVSTQSRSIEVQATVPNPKYVLYPGVYVDVSTYLPEQENVVTLPQTAVTFSLYGDIVYIVKKEGKDEKGQPILRAYQHYIKVGDRVGNLVEIKEGVKVGDEVITSGQLKLRDGVRVKINNSVQLKKIDTSQLKAS